MAASPLVSLGESLDPDHSGRIREMITKSCRDDRAKARDRRALLTSARLQPARAFTRLVRREIFRETAFLCTIPFWAARASFGSASCSAAAAAPASFAASASSTLRTKVRMSLRRDLLTAVRRSILRTAFFAELVLAIERQSSKGSI